MEEILFNIEQYIISVGAFGPVVYVAVMVVAIVVSPIPSSPLAIFAGTVFGLWWGMLYTMIGATVGAIIAFYIARIFGRPFVLKFISKKELETVEDGFSEQGIAWSIFALRLLPLPFFDAVSYAAGLTKISIKNFFVATFFGLMPLVFIFSYFGDVFSDNLILVVLAVIAVTILFFIFAKIVYAKRNKKYSSDGK